MKPVLNFEDTEIAFSLKSKGELKWANMLFKLIGNKYLTSMAKPITNFLFWMRFPIRPILKYTVFKQFCGGESIAECEPLIVDMFNKKGVYSIPDYSVEGKQNEEQFDLTLRTTLQAYDFSKKSWAVPFLVFKGTGLGRFEIFEKVSAATPLNDSEKEEWERIVSRVDTICEKCERTPDMKVMIDAEESWIQDAIDKLAEEMMGKYNKKRVVVFNTVQLYRWDRLEYLEYIDQKAKKENFLIDHVTAD